MTNAWWNRKNKIVLGERQIKGILRHYAARGGKAVPDLARRYGVSEHYIKQLAWTHGVRVLRPKGGRTPSANDPRWEWAKQRGNVIA